MVFSHELVDVVHPFHHICGIHAVVACIKHRNTLEGTLDARPGIDGNLRRHVVTTLRVDQDHSIGCLGTIDGCSILEYLYALNVVWWYEGKWIAEVTGMERCLVILRLPDDSIYNIEWCVGHVGRMDSSNQNLGTDGIYSWLTYISYCTIQMNVYIFGSGEGCLCHILIVVWGEGGQGLRCIEGFAARYGNYLDSQVFSTLECYDLQLAAWSLNL